MTLTVADITVSDKKDGGLMAVCLRKTMILYQGGKRRGVTHSTGGGLCSFPRRPSLLHRQTGRMILMPNVAKRLCAHPGCPNVTDKQYCAEHAKLHARPSVTKQGYGYRWQQRSKRFLRDHPLCASCQKDGKLTPAAVVDHIIPHRGDTRLFWDASNWQPLCKRCHDTKTANEDGGFGRNITY